MNFRENSKDHQFVGKANSDGLSDGPILGSSDEMFLGIFIGNFRVTEPSENSEERVPRYSEEGVPRPPVELSSGSPRKICDHPCPSTEPNVDNNAGGSSRKLASTIVTPVREPPMVENLTLRARGDARSLTFSPLRETEPSGAKDQIIEALHDMELVDQQDGDMLDAKGNEDDLLGLDLMEMEDNGGRDKPPESEI
ncbi:hypothetical protein F2Q70_00013141 [Brassica cretica]|uniref:Uncharacterized protein n=1 Tax=Brassica cretica TaxID=69181 RepID=A0A8S9M9W0_BRACR|nr:hypothetical protein F2Q70_00013141 [Brassica cretica]